MFQNLRRFLKTLLLQFHFRLKKDIILREDLEELQAQHPNRFKLWFTLITPQKVPSPLLGVEIRGSPSRGFWSQ